jgi:tricorn protease-like protein
MSSSPEPSPAPGVGADAKLLLRVQRPGEPVDEVFVQPGLRLGRAPDNHIKIEHETVDRQHAEVVEERGQYELRCTSGAWVEVEGQRQERVMLVPGVRFRLGPAEIECCAAEERYEPAIEVLAVREQEVEGALIQIRRCWGVVLGSMAQRPAYWGLLLAGAMLMGLLCGALSAFLLGWLYGLSPGDWHFGCVLGGVVGVLAGMGALVHWVCRKRPLGWKATCRSLLVSMLGSAVSVLLLGWLPWASFWGPVAPRVLCFTGHEGTVWSVAVTPDGRYVVSGSGDWTVRLWELRTGREVRRFTGHQGQVNSVAVTPDGRYVVSGSGDWTVRVWELRTGRELRRFTGHLGRVYSVAVTPDGRYVVSGSWDWTVRVWELGTGREVHRFTGHKKQVYSVAVTPDGRYVVSGSGGSGSERDTWIVDNTVRLWELETGQDVRPLTGHESGVNSVTVTPDGRYVVSGSWDWTVRVWELETGEEVRRLMGTSGVTSMAVTPDGRYVLTGSEDRTVRVWELETGQEVRCFTGHMGMVWSVAVTPDGRYVVSGSSDGTVRLWYIGDLK